MSWKLWVDDQWDDPETPFRHPTEGFTPARSVGGAMALVEANGLPSFMQLDHDLGDLGGKITEFLRWMANTYPDGPVPEFKIHSKNPEGAKNAESILDSWKRSLE